MAEQEPCSEEKDRERDGQPAGEDLAESGCGSDDSRSLEACLKVHARMSVL